MEGAHLSCALKKTGVQVEHITWVGLSAGWASKKERHLSVGDGLLGEIVVDDEAVLAVVSEVLTNGTAGVGGQELEGCSF